MVIECTYCLVYNGLPEEHTHVQKQGQDRRMIDEIRDKIVGDQVERLQQTILGPREPSRVIEAPVYNYLEA